MSRSSARRGQTEPLAALAAVLALGIALSLYAGTLRAADPGQSDATAEVALGQVHDAVSDGAVAVPPRLDDALAAGPRGQRLNVTLSAAGQRWTAGPTPPPGGEADAARRPASVRVGNWTTRPGRLRVVVWS